MNARQFRKWLARQGCVFSPGRGGHLKVRRGERSSQLPMHGARQQLGTGLIEKIKKDLDLK
ncbi:MAG: type II toxin-antitoxin system HicA family toxin [Pseudomonadota bacterium]